MSEHLPPVEWDVLIVGGGPAGAAAGIHAARQGLKALIIEKDRHPRFHIGESMLPQADRALRMLPSMSTSLSRPCSC